MTAVKILLVIPFVLAISPMDLFVVEKREAELADMLWSSIFGSVTAGEIQTIVLTMEITGVIFLFTLLFGTRVSRHFESNSHMVFTRIEKRGRWGLGQILMVCVLALVYTGIYLGRKVILESRKLISWRLDGALLVRILLLLGILLPGILLICLMANWIAIRGGIAVGVLTAFAVLLVLETISIYWFQIPAMNVLNPFCANIAVLSSPGTAVMKIGVNLAYAAALSAGMIWDIRRMDIF